MAAAQQDSSSVTGEDAATVATSINTTTTTSPSSSSPLNPLPSSREEEQTKLKQKSVFENRQQLQQPLTTDITNNLHRQVESTILSSSVVLGQQQQQQQQKQQENKKKILKKIIISGDDGDGREELNDYDDSDVQASGLKICAKSDISGSSRCIAGGVGLITSNNNFVSNNKKESAFTNSSRPLILITDSNSAQFEQQSDLDEENQRQRRQDGDDTSSNRNFFLLNQQKSPTEFSEEKKDQQELSSFSEEELEKEEEEENFEIVDGIRYKIVAAVTKPPANKTKSKQSNNNNKNKINCDIKMKQQQEENKNMQMKFNSMRRKSSAFVSNLLSATFANNNTTTTTTNDSQDKKQRPQRRLSIYEMTKSPPPETSLEIYLNERRRSSTVSSKQIQQQLEQQSTFETNYCQRQQYFKDLNQKLINQDKKLLNVVANRGQIHRHSVDIAQLPLHLAQAKAKSASASTKNIQPSTSNSNSANKLTSQTANRIGGGGGGGERRRGGKQQSGSTRRVKRASGGIIIRDGSKGGKVIDDHSQRKIASNAINQNRNFNSNKISGDDSQTDDFFEKKKNYQISSNGECYYDDDDQQNQDEEEEVEDEEEEEEEEDYSDDDGGGGGDLDRDSIAISNRLVAIRENKSSSLLAAEARGSIASRSSARKSRMVIRKFQKLDESLLSSTPAPDVKIGQRVAYKEYYGNEFGTIRWIGRVPQICPDWTVGVEFDNAIGEGDGSLNGRRYFIAKDCFAKFLPLNAVALVDQHVGRPEPGTMISVMSAAVRPGQMISIQRVSTVHVQHCFLNAPHRRPGADILAVNTRLHCQCPNCGPCAHVIKPPRTQRLARGGKNATHMCQFSTYTCCGMESQEETMCTYEGNKVISLPPPPSSSLAGLPPIGNSWIEGSGYLTNLQAQQSKLMPEEYKLGAAPEDIGTLSVIKRGRHGNKSTTSYGRGRGKHHHKSHKRKRKQNVDNTSPINSPSHLNGETNFVNGYNFLDYKDKLISGDNSDNNYFTSPTDLVPYNLSSSVVNSNFDDSLAVTQLDKQATYSYEQSKEGAENNNHNNNNICPNDSIDRIYENNGNKGKIVYRDSIENRYLFPTDDPIDSILEQDLENLSQARYGHCNNSSRQNGSKNIIVKSLRSLVSCLNPQTNNSDFDMRHTRNNKYENEINNNQSVDTIKYSENYGIIVKPDNKSIPIELTTESYNNRNQKQIIYTNDCDKEKNGDNLSKSSSFSPCSKQTNYYQNYQENYQAFKKKDIQNYSSSDCGFSSASQNSINFRVSSNNMGCSILSNFTDNQVYHRIISKLINSNSIKDEDLIKLKELIIEPRENCCLHNMNILSNHNSTDIDQIIADVIKNSYLNQDKKIELNQKTNSTICHARNNYYSNINHDDIKENSFSFCNNENCKHPPRSLNEGSTAESLTLSSNDSFSSSTNTSDIDKMGSKKNQQNAKKETKNQDCNNLPKAFELKLTLSINNTEKTKTENSSEYLNKITDNSNPNEVNKIVVSDISSSLINSSLDINIEPNKNDQNLLNIMNQNTDDKDENNEITKLQELNDNCISN